LLNQIEVWWQRHEEGGSTSDERSSEGS
jgi:hypothetical protein